MADLVDRFREMLERCPPETRERLDGIFDPTVPAEVLFVAREHLKYRPIEANPTPIRVVYAIKYQQLVERVAQLEAELAEAVQAERERLAVMAEARAVVEYKKADRYHFKGMYALANAFAHGAKQNQLLAKEIRALAPRTDP